MLIYRYIANDTSCLIACFCNAYLYICKIVYLCTCLLMKILTCEHVYLLTCVLVYLFTYVYGWFHPGWRMTAKKLHYFFLRQNSNLTKYKYWRVTANL